MSTVERIPAGCVLGEAPHWDGLSQNLFFVDVIGQSILKYESSTKKLTRASLAPQSPTFIVPVEGKTHQFIVGASNELKIISWDGESDKVTTIEKLTSIEKISKASNTTFNDGKCDSSGRLWAGTQSLAADFRKSGPLGALYTFNAQKQLKSQLEDIRIANGLAFNDATKKMFYIDSLKHTVDQFDFDVKNGTISNRQEWFNLKKSGIHGIILDGMTIDTDGNLWVAVFGGGKVLKVDGSKPQTLLDTIEIPAEQVTSLAWGGLNLDELYVTTGSWELDGKKFPHPVNGATYKVTGTGSKGHPAPNFKLN